MIGKFIQKQNIWRFPNKSIYKTVIILSPPLRLLHFRFATSIENLSPQKMLPKSIIFFVPRHSMESLHPLICFVIRISFFDLQHLYECVFSQQYFVFAPSLPLLAAILQLSISGDCSFLLHSFQQDLFFLPKIKIQSVK